MAPFCWMLSLLLVPGMQEPAVDDERALPPPGVEIRVELSAVQTGRVHSFRIRGETNLPDGVRLLCRVYALSEIVLQGEKILDEEPLLYDDPVTGATAFVECDVKDGKIEVSLYSFPKALYSLRYRGRVFYDPDRQSPEIRERVGAGRFSALSDLRLGTEEDFSGEIAAAVQEVDGELSQLSDLCHELQREFESARRPEGFDAAAWKKRTDELLEKIDVVQARNRGRYDLWAVWVERQGKLRIEGLCETLKRMTEETTAHLEGEEAALQRAQGRMESFSSRLEEAREVLGVDAPIRPAEVRRLLSEYEPLVRRVEEIAAAGKAPGDWAEERARLQRSAQKILLEMIQHLPKRGHLRVRELSARWRELLETGSKEPFSLPEWDTARARHRTACEEFRTYAGIR